MNNQTTDIEHLDLFDAEYGGRVERRTMIAEQPGIHIRIVQTTVDGQLHSINGYPSSVTYTNGIVTREVWHKDHFIHREIGDGPADICYKDGIVLSEEYIINGEIKHFVQKSRFDVKREQLVRYWDTLKARAKRNKPKVLKMFGFTKVDETPEELDKKTGELQALDGSTFVILFSLMYFVLKFVEWIFIPSGFVVIPVLITAAILLYVTFNVRMYIDDTKQFSVTFKKKIRK